MAAVMAEYATVDDALSRPGPSPSSAAHQLYKVRNVDDKGRIIHIGYLEVSEFGVVFTYEHYPSETAQWPLTCIRRYGVNAVDGVFAIEVGRRSPTGEGTYAFRSEDAEEISRKMDYFISMSNVPVHSLRY